MFAAFLFTLAVLQPLPAQPPAPRPPGGPLPLRMQNATAPSHVFTRGDVEILTYETEQDYDRLQQLYRDTQNARPQPGTPTVLYLRSRTDGSVQPYSIRLPLGFDPGRRYPLVIQLHGLNFHEVLSGARVRYRGMAGPQWIEPDLPVIYAQCFGRPSAFYRGMGEEDVLEVLADVEQRFPVDRDRAYVMGHSMGGSGSYTVGLHYPDLFGGIMPIDAAMWARNAPPEPPPPAWMQPQIAIHWPDRLYPNARNVDVFFKNAGAGIQRNSTEFADGIVAEGGFATMESFPGMPHNFGDQYAYANFIPELIQHPIRRHPAEVRFYTDTLRYNRAYWVTIDRLTRHNADARVTAKCDDQGTVRVETANIDALTLRLEDTPAAKAARVSVIVDGAAVLTAAVPATVHISKPTGPWRVGEWPANGLVKRHGLQGPLDDAFNSRFLAVYGDGDRDLAIAELDAVRNPPGPMDIHGDFPMKPAAKVTRADIDAANLILFGTPQTNAVLRRIAPSLPPALLRETDGARSIFIYPNPENPSKYVVVWQTKLLSGPEPPHYGWIMPLCLLPDYAWVKDGKITSAGHFDSDWALK